MRKALLILVIVAAAGCINSAPAGGGLSISMQPDPPKIFSHGTTRINIDLENTNPRPITASFDIFDTGRLTFAQQPPGAACGLDNFIMLKNDFKSFFCVLQAPDIEEESVLTEVNAWARYKTSMPVVQVIEMMTEAEYQRRAGQAALTKPASYSYRDKNVEVRIDFDEPLPIVLRRGHRYFMHFTIKNIGNGLIGSLKYNDFSVRPAGATSFSIVDCRNSGIDNPNWRLEPVGKEFPSITCELTMPSGVSAVENYGMLVTLEYNYEVREKALVQIIK